jgi:hypothetical protein
MSLSSALSGRTLPGQSGHCAVSNGPNYSLSEEQSGLNEAQPKPGNFDPTADLAGRVDAWLQPKDFAITCKKGRPDPGVLTASGS